MCILGLMGEDMKVNIKMIKNTVMVFILGLIKDNIKEYGIRGNSMH